MFGDADSLYRSNGHSSCDELDSNGLLGDFKMPDFSSDLDLGGSFLDDVMKALNQCTGDGVSSTTETNGDMTNGASSLDDLPTPNGDQPDTLPDFSSHMNGNGSLKTPTGRDSMDFTQEFSRAAADESQYSPPHELMSVPPPVPLARPESEVGVKLT